MLILGLVTGGIFAAFVFARQVSYRSEAEILAQSFTQQLAEQLRLRMGGTGNMPIDPGVYFDPDYDEPGPDVLPTNPCAGVTWRKVDPTEIPVELRVPVALRDRYQLRWKYYVENQTTRVESPCGGPARGRDFDGDGITDINWTKVKVDWGAPR